jgi:AcrR family transcriptional regulator
VVVAEGGYSKATVARITDTASVSRRTFYEHFKSRDACFLAAYLALDDYLATLMQEAVESHEEWPEQVAATLAAVIGFLASRPNFARLYLVESSAVGEAMTPLREKTADRFIALLAPGRKLRSGDRELAEGLEEALVGGIVTLLARRVVRGEAERLTAFTPAVLELGLTPYLGVEESRRIASDYA